MQPPTRTPARHLHLSAQGLRTTRRTQAALLALRQCVQYMQLLNINTINVVARSPCAQPE